MPEAKITIKQGKERALQNRHHWIFSGAIQKMDPFTDGDVCPVYSYDNKFLAKAYFNKKSSIIGRIISFEDISTEQAIHKQLQSALDLRSLIFKEASAYRLVNGEGDLLPGLIIDRYNDTFVLQIGTLGMSKLTPIIVSWLVENMRAKSIYEKSNLPSRREEGLTDRTALLYGDDPSKAVIIEENGLKFSVLVTEGQKTGFFLDHRMMRNSVRTLVKNLGLKRVLNCFSYTGAFSVYAADGGASLVDSVDISKEAVLGAKRNMELNGFKGHGFIAEDVFNFLHEKPLDYDLVILDPPAFAKKKEDVIQACRGYKEINRMAMQKMPKGSLLLTSSCSYHVDETLFQTVVFQAAVEAKRTVRIIGRHLLAPDHPINICHKEGDYLKSLLLYIAD